MSLGLIYDDCYLEHDEPTHPENASRLRAILGALDADPELMDALTPLNARSATDAELCAVHDQRLITQLTRLAADGDWVDVETYLLPQSVEIARRSAGGTIAAVDAVLSGTVDQAFALVRPPGHHATPTRSMGFCLFNNAAVAAAFARREYGLQRVVVLDWDVHHGNGTQDIFANDPHVFYISTHGWPLWPGSGHRRETGPRAGAGTTLNIPLPQLAGDMGFDRVFQNLIVPAVRRFRPDLLIVSAGYDAHLNDPLGPLALSTAGYAHLAGIVYNLAQEVCGGRLVGVLEGGYNVDALASSVVATLRRWCGLPQVETGAYGGLPIAEPDITRLIEALRSEHPLLAGT